MIVEVKDISELLSIDNLLNRKIKQLSGGEQQRICIARAIVNNPPILLADEPTGNLDTRTGEDIMNLFEELHSMGHTIILVTHEPDIAKRALRHIQLRDGIITDDYLVNGSRS